jgi:hypothetical protein
LDSTRQREPPVTAPEAPEAIPTVSPRLAVRLGQAMPLLRRAEKGARGVAKVSAAAAFVLAVTLEWGALRTGTVDWPVAIAGLVVLLVPAALTWLGVGTLRALLTLPGRLRTGAAEAADYARVVATQSAPRGTRIGGFLKALWAARTLAMDARGALNVGTAVRAFQLTRLPLLVLMALGFMLNFVVIAAAVVALIVVAVV